MSHVVEEQTAEDAVRIKTSQLKLFVTVLALIGTLLTLATGYWDVKRTTEQNAARIAAIEQIVQMHTTATEKHLNREDLKEAKQTLQEKVDDLRDQIQALNNKLDRILLRGR